MTEGILEMLKCTYVRQPDHDCSIYNGWLRVLVVVILWECKKGTCVRDESKIDVNYRALWSGGIWF